MFDGLVKRARGGNIRVDIAFLPSLSCQLQGLGVLQEQALRLLIFFVQVINVFLKSNYFFVRFNQIVLTLFQVVSNRLTHETAFFGLFLQSRDFFEQTFDFTVFDSCEGLQFDPNPF